MAASAPAALSGARPRRRLVVSASATCASIVLGCVAGWLVGRSTGSVLALVLTGAAASLGPYGLWRRRARRGGEPRRSPGSDLDTLHAEVRQQLAVAAARVERPASLDLGTMIVWLAGLLVLDGLLWQLLPHAGRPRLSHMPGYELLAFATSLPIMFEGGRWIEPLVGRSVLEKQNLEHRETARAVLAEPAVLPSTPAPAAHGHDAASGEIGWRVSGIGLPVAMSLGFSGIGAAMIVDPGAGVLVHVFGAFVILVFGLNVVSLVGNAVRYPVALRIDETGIDIAQRGPIPWAAVRRCTIQTYNRTRTLAVWVGEPGESLARIRRQPWMTRRLRRRIRRAPFHSISLRVLDASIPEITAQLRRYGRVLGEGDFQPRLDGFYEAQEQGLRARFQLDGTVRLGAETGTWSAQDDGLKIETGEREQFATLNSDGLFLVSKSGLVRMRFVRDPG